MMRVEYLRCQNCGMQWRRIGLDLKVERPGTDPCRDCVAIVKQYKGWMRNRYTANAASDAQINIHSAMIQEVK